VGPRYQYILSGASLPHFQGILVDLLLPQQLQRIGDALKTLEPETVSPVFPRAVIH